MYTSSQQGDTFLNCRYDHSGATTFEFDSSITMVTESDQNHTADLVYIVLEVAIAVLAILGNILVCWAVCINSNLQNATNYFVVSLAAADIAVGVLAIPFAIAISTGFCATFHACLFIACFVLVLTQSSIFSLLAIAADRYIAIRIPLRYNSLVTSRRANVFIAICWLLSFVIGLTPMLGWHKDAPPSSNKTHHCQSPMIECLFENVVTMDYMVYYNFFACVLVPLLLMLGIYLRIFMAARHQLKQMKLKVTCGERSRSTLQREVHAAKSLAIIVGLFALCWLPLHIINCFTLFCQACDRPSLWIMYLAILLSHTNSVVNPLIYAYRIREFRHTFRKIIRQHLLGQGDSLKTRTASAKSLTYFGVDEETGINQNRSSNCKPGTQINGSICKFKEGRHQNGYQSGPHEKRTVSYTCCSQNKEMLEIS